jgi:hypothetical protein
MQYLIVISQYLAAHWLEIVGYIATTLTGLYGLALLIPGEQPDKAIKFLLTMTEKVSRK